MVTLIGEAKGDIDLEDLQNNLSNYDSLKCASHQTCAEVGRFPALKVFISWRVAMPKAREIQEIMASSAKRAGLEACFVHNPMGLPLTAEVEKQIKSSRGFFQLISFSNDETELRTRGQDVKPSLEWLYHEHGVATGVGLPKIRMVDTSMWAVPLWKRHLAIGRDEWAFLISGTKKVK